MQRSFSPPVQVPAEQDCGGYRGWAIQKQDCPVPRVKQGDHPQVPHHAQPGQHGHQQQRLPGGTGGIQP